MQATQTNPGRVLRRSTSSELAPTLQPATDAAARLKRRVGRFEIYDFFGGHLSRLHRLEASQDSKAVGPWSPAAFEGWFIFGAGTREMRCLNSIMFDCSSGPYVKNDFGSSALAARQCAVVASTVYYP